MTLGNKYSFLNRDNLTQPIHMYFSQKQKVFSQYASTFFKFTLNFDHFKTKMTSIAYIFPKKPPPKHVVR